jgi:ADP-heptose:LPS heptosyltransferase
MVRVPNLILNWLLWNIGLHLPKRKNCCEICIVKNDLIGDFILFIPVLRQLREAHPGSAISIVVKEPVAALLRSCPYVDSVIVLDESSFRRRPFYRIRILLQMYARKFSKTIYGCYSRNYIGDMVSLWTAAPVRVAWDSDSNHMSVRENIRGNRSYTQLVPGTFTPEVHEAVRNAFFSVALGVSSSDSPVEQARIWLDEQAEAEATGLLREYRLDGKRFIAVLPGASFPLKNWGERNYCELCRVLLSTGASNFNFVLCGQEGDALDLTGLEPELATKVVDLAGKTSLLALASIFKRAVLVVGNDTGTMHMAIAVDSPTVCIVGGGHFGRFMPYGSTERHVFLSHQLPCYHCNWNCIYDHAVCIAEISVSQVVEACKEVLKADHRGI